MGEPVMELPDESSTFRVFLQDELNRRISRNSAYSIRAFANALGINDSTLSQMLRGKRKISPKTIIRLSSQLQITDSQVKKYIHNYLKGERDETQVEQLAWDTFHFISEWYYESILVLISTKNFRPEPRWIAKKLGLTVAEVNTAVDRLQRLGYVKINSEGQWVNAVGSTETDFEPHVTSTALKKYQGNLLEKSTQALDEIPKIERSHGSLIIGVAREDIDELKKQLINFRKKFMQNVLKKKKTPDSVYALQVSFFPLSVSSEVSHEN